MKRKLYRGFTLLEMLFVIFIIGTLIMLFVPNLMKNKDVVTTKGEAAIVKVVDTQKEIYATQHNQADLPTAETLEKEGYISKQQLATYNEALQKAAGK